jgi:hypothetical protein
LDHFSSQRQAMQTNFILAQMKPTGHVPMVLFRSPNP